jgi:hypothetical protein
MLSRHTRDAASPSLLRLLALLVTLRRGGFRLSAIAVADSVPVLFGLSELSRMSTAQTPIRYSAREERPRDE